MKTSLPIHYIRVFGDPVLKQECEEISDFGPDLHRLVDVMFEVMDRENGVGLAASQIGILQKVIVWAHPETDERYVLVNPRVIDSSEEAFTGPESCLSVPGYSVEVTRPVAVVVEAHNMVGDPVTLEVNGFLARIVQHEIDHLEGQLILDRTSAEERRRVLKEMREQALES